MKRLALVAVAVIAVTTGCSSSPSPADAEAALKQAAQKLDSTSGVELTLTGQPPTGINAMNSATGTATSAPAFEGQIGVLINSLPVTVKVVAVDNKVYAVLPFTTDYVPIDPSKYGAPDPAQFLNPDHGVPAWLNSVADGPHTSKQVRDGSDVLTEFSGTVSGKLVTDLLPTADASETFDVRARVDSSGTMTAMWVTGPFYKGSDSMTYEIDVTSYDVQKTISAP
jgi:lipoprotein LprG